MRVLFDQGTPAPLRRMLGGHDVATAHECGWSTMTNGDLLAAAETAGFEVFVTTDGNLKYQQNLATRAIAIVVLSTTSWPRIEAASTIIGKAIDLAAPRSFVEVSIP